MSEHDAPVPVSMLSGFLGAGKTTLLRHMLTQSDLKIGCIVNDVASVNIDAKLIRNTGREQHDAGPRGVAGDDASKLKSTADLTDTIELANGCACCSIADELFDSFENLLNIAKKRGITYDRIVLENSGVAEPQNIRDQFNEARAVAHPLVEKVYLDTMVTVVDSASFTKDYASKAPVAARPELGDGGGMRPVVDLLVEQVECADFIVLNKVDMLEEKVVDSLEAIVSSLNPLARVFTCEHGKVDIDELLGPDVHGLVSNLNTEAHHKGAVVAARAVGVGVDDDDDDGDCLEHGAGVDHGHSCEGRGCGPDSHKHGHDGHDPDDQKDQKDHECEGGSCKYASHKHSHDHHDHRGHKCEDGACSHGSHVKKRSKTTAAKRFGIASFVYERRRPFHPVRLKELVLKWMPVAVNKEVEDHEKPEDPSKSPIRTVLRSKGFMWISNSHSTAYYWSHAGQHFEIRNEGDWWDSIPREEWPEEDAPRNAILADFDENNGDRRQEIVFIGVGMDEKAISAQLDSALLTEEEMGKYAELWLEDDRKR